MKSLSFARLGILFRPLGAVFLLMLAGMAPAAADLKVVVSVKPVHSIVAGLMHGLDAPALLIGDGQTPYNFEPSAAQQAMLAEADLILWVGPELEASLVKPLAALGQKARVVEMLANPGIKVLPSRAEPDKRDPYFWLDSRNMLILIDDIAHLLQDADPQRAHVYERNRRTVMAEVARLDREYEYGYRGLKAGVGLEYYDTLQYFEQAYALKVRDRVAGSPRQAVDAATLLRVRQSLKAGEAVCLLTEAGMPAEHLSLLTEGTDVNVGELDSLGGSLPAGPGLYVALMDHNTDVIKRCLNADMTAARAARHQALEDDAVGIEGIGGEPFLLTDHLGRLVSDETMRGKYQILYFGYTYCPDICPTSLQILFQGMHLLGAKADQIQTYFITIDPERDTVGKMRDYVQYYDERLIGVTGSREMIGRMAALFRAKYEKVVEEGGDPNLYLMDHSASLYLLDPEGRFITKFAHGIAPEELAARLDQILP